MDLIKPGRLRAGDRIAAISLSSGLAGLFPNRYAQGKRQLEEAFGVELVDLAHTHASPEFLAANPQARVDDLHQALADPDIAGILSCIGGDESIRLLPLIDHDLIRANPKVFLGFSDTTVTHSAFLRAGVVSFYGPSILAGFDENGGLFPYMEEGVRRMLFEPEPEVVWPENRDAWTVELLDWADTANDTVARERRPATGWRWDGSGVAEGPLIPACIEVLDWLRGTPWWPDLDGAVLAIETSEEAPPAEYVTRMLRTLVPTGELHRLAAILLGRPGGDQLPVDAHEAYDDAVRQVVRDENGLDMPLVFGADFGHTDPVWTLPFGVRTRVDADARTITFREPAVS